MTDSSINSSKFDGKGFSILNTGGELGDVNFSIQENGEAGKLQSRQFVTILDLLAEGEIAGFATPHRLQIPFNPENTSKYQIIGLRDVFLNKTPVLKSTAPDTLADIDLANDFNFGTSPANIPRTVSRVGTADQTNIKFLNQTERELLNQRIKVTKSPTANESTDTSITSNFNQELTVPGEFDALRVTLMFPSLFSNNGENGTKVEYSILILDTNDNVKKGITFKAEVSTFKVDWYRWADVVKGGVTYAIYSFNYDPKNETSNYPVDIELRFSEFNKTTLKKRNVQTFPNTDLPARDSQTAYSRQVDVSSSDAEFSNFNNSNIKPPFDQIADKFIYKTNSNPSPSTVPSISSGVVNSSNTDFINSVPEVTTTTNGSVTTIATITDKDNNTHRVLNTFDTYSDAITGRDAKRRRNKLLHEDDDGYTRLLNWPRQLTFDRSLITQGDDPPIGFDTQLLTHQNSFKIAIPLTLTDSSGQALVHPAKGSFGTCNIETSKKFIDNDITIEGGSVTGKTLSPYFKDHILNIQNIENSDYPIKIKVRKETPDSQDSSINNDLFVSGLTGLIARKDTYENSAYTAVRFDAQVFGSIPTRLYRIRGKKVKIPHNATVNIATGSITYSGAFNGTFKTDLEWTNDPAWILFDLLTDTRVGMGQQVTDDLIDKFAFFEASKYNNETITGEDGVDKPRFSFNKSFQTPTDAFSLLNQVAESMRASLFVSEGRISLSQDRPADSVYFFSYANVLEGGFGYTGPAQSSRDTIVNVKFFDNEKREFDLVTVNASEVITNSSLETLYGENIRNLEAVGCTDRDQAKRFGRWHIFTQNNQADIVNFSTNAAAGTLLNPGDVITIQDPMKSNTRVSGRVSSFSILTDPADRLTLTLDLFPDGVTSVDPNDKFFIILKTIQNQSSITSNHITKLNAESDTESLPFIKKELTILSIDATEKTITFSDPSNNVGNAIQVNTVWVYEKASQAETQDYRIISISEEENVYSISAVVYDATKYSVIETGDSEKFESNQVLTTLVPPDNLQAEESIIVENNNAVNRLTVSWSYAKGVSNYLVTLTNSSGAQEDQTTVFVNQYEKVDLLNGRYTIRVQSKNFIGITDQNFNEITFDVKKSQGRPATPQNLALNIVNDQEVNLLFNKSTDLDVFFGGNVQIDHLSNTTAPSDIRNTIGNIGTFDGNTDSVVVANLPGIYVVKFEDNSTNLSAISTIVNSDFSSEGERQLKFVDEANINDTNPFNGTKTNCQYDSSKSALILTDPTEQNSGVYTFANTLDLGANTNVTIERILQATGYYPGGGVNFSERSQRSGLNVSQWASFSGLIAVDGNVELLVQTTEGDPASANFDNIPFLPVKKSVFKGRGFKFTLRFSVTDNAQNIAIEKLGFKMSLKSRTEINSSPISNVVSGNPASKTVTFDKAFYSGSSNTDITDHAPRVAVTIQPDSNGALQNNETVKITNVKSNEFTVDIKDSSGNFVTRNFNYSAVGFGTINS